MTTLEEAPQAVIDTVITEPPAETLECQVCGRDCRHVPATAGGGTAGGVKGEKWNETVRSQLNCPACGGKPHRKEGRIYQEIACQYRQAMSALGSTTLLHPNEAIYLRLAEMARTETFNKVPTEKEVHDLIRQKLGLPPIEPKVRAAKAPKSAIIRQKTKADEADTSSAEVVPDAAIDLADLSDLAPKVVAPPAEDAPGVKKKAVREPKAPKAPKKSRKSKAAEAGSVPAEEAASPIAEGEVEVEAGALNTEDGDLNPFAGVGMPFPEDDDEEEELTPEQIAAIK